MIALYRAAALVAAVALALGGAAQAQIVHRLNVDPGEATPTGASFSIYFPVPYSDVELHQDADSSDMVVRAVTGITKDGVRLSASETPFVAGVPPQPIEDFMNALKANSAVVQLLDVQHRKMAGIESLSFTLIDIAGGGNFFDVIRTDKAQYTLLIQFHRDERDKAAAMKDDFFGSFKLTGQ